MSNPFGLTRDSFVLEVYDEHCPLCGEEHDKSMTYNGVVMVGCPEMREGWILPLRRVSPDERRSMAVNRMLATSEE